MKNLNAEPFGKTGDILGEGLEPTVANVHDTLSRLESFWGELHRQQELDHQVYSLELKFSAPEGYSTVYPGTGFTVVQVAADHIAGEGALVKIPVPANTLTQQRQSEKIEKWVQAALARFESQATVPQLRSIVTDFCWAGMAVSQGPLFDKEAWPEDPMTKASSLTGDDLEEAVAEYKIVKERQWPLLWRIVDPRWVFPDPGTHGRKYVIVSFRRNVGEIRANWPHWKGRVKDTSRPYRDTDEVTFVEYWDSEYRSYYAGGEELDLSKHRYGKPTFQIQSAGLGSESGKPHERYRSLLWAARNMFEQEIVVMSQIDANMRNAAWTQMLTPIGSNFKQLKPGTTVRMQPEHIELTKSVTEIRSDVIQALVQEQQIIDQKIQDATYPAVVRGVKVSDVGYTNNSLAALARIRFGTMAKAAEALMQTWVADLLHCVEKIVQEPIPIYGPTRRGFVSMDLGPNDIAGMRYSIVKLNPKLPVDRANEIAVGQILLELGIIDRDTFTEDFAGYEQPEELRVKVLRDRIMDSPLVQSILHIAAAEEMGLVDYLADQAEKSGLPRAMAYQAILAMLPNGSGQAPGGPAGGPPGAPLNGSGGGTPDMSMFPTAQTQPVPGGPADAKMFTQKGAAEAAGVPRPGVRYQ